MRAAYTARIRVAASLMGAVRKRPNRMTVSLPSAVKAAPMSDDELAAWYAGKAPRRLLAIPFSGPIGGKDLEGEFFDASTDIKPDWFEARPVLWHHGTDPFGMGTSLLGKADNLGARDGSVGPDDDGWWCDLWLRAGERNVQRVKALEQRGATLLGSSAAIPHLVKRGKSGHIEVWPYIEQTLTTAPINRRSTFAPSMKAVLDDFSSAQIAVPDLIREVMAELDTLRDLRPDLSSDGDGAAKAAVDEALMDTLRNVAADADDLLTTIRGSAAG